MEDISLGSLNATYVTALFKDCLIKDISRESITAILFQKQYGFPEDSRPIFFDKELVQFNKKTINYVLGQLKDVHTQQPFTSIDSVVSKYDDTIWTNNRNVVIAFLHLALAAGAISPINAKNSQINFLKDLMPTVDVFDPNYSEWYRNNKPKILKKFSNGQEPADD